MRKLLLLMITLLTLYKPVQAREACGVFVDMGTFKCTAYCPCCDCSEGYDDTTAMETKAEEGHTIAVDPDVIAFGTQILIGDTVYTAEDCGGAVQGDHIDIYMEDHDRVDEFGVKYLHVYIVKEVEY